MQPVVLLILDGWGYSKQKLGNAILNAKTPNLNQIESSYPSLLLQASGKATGMIWGEAGNSEVGHLTIGAGRVIFQYLSRVNKAIENGQFFENPALMGAISHVQKNNSTLHILGLLTSGSVHAYFNHLLALIDLSKRNDLTKVNIHLFTDGKDSGLKEALVLVKKLQNYIVKQGVGKISSIIGRDYAMDRTKNWESTRKTYELLVLGQGRVTIEGIPETLESYYKEGLDDAKIPATVILKDGYINDNDGLIFFNFREDSMRQLVRTFSEEGFNIFEKKNLNNLFIAATTQYIESKNIHVAFPVPEIKNGLSEVLSKKSKKQLHIAETEKYAHITYFFNCLNNEPFNGETDFFIESVKDPLANPEMKTREIGEKIISELQRDYYHFIVANIASPDILAHSGNLEITTAGIEVVDETVEKIKRAILDRNGFLIITADHGNAESLVYKSSGEKETHHNENPVPFYFVAKEYVRLRSRKEIEINLSEPKGLLSDIAPTILELLEVEKPIDMIGDSLIKSLALI